MINSKVIGILAIQGAYVKHRKAIEKLGYNSLFVRNKQELDSVDRLIIPGGESTAMIIILKKHGMWNDLKSFCKHHPVFGTCAGTILLAKKTHGLECFGEDNTFSVMDIEVTRNSYGRQLESFKTNLEVDISGSIKTIPAIFIRAPQVIGFDEEKVKVLSYCKEIPVLLRQNNYLACTFHPELTDCLDIHEYFCKL